MSDEADKKRRIRSPEFPYISLKEAITRLEQMQKQYQRHPARIKNLAPVWNFSEGSSSLLRNVAALLSYGVVEESASGSERKIAISELGMRVIADKRPGVAEAALAKAFENCAILGEYHRKWGKQRPPDHECLSELTLDNGFSEAAAKKFISVYDDSVVYVEEKPSDSAAGEEDENGADDPLKFDVGMYVQWEQGGVLQLERAAKLVGFSANGKYAFIEGSSTGIPRTELIAADAPLEVDAKSKPPKDSAASRTGGMNMTEATYPLAEGTCTLIYPADISEKSAKRLKRWLDLMLEDVAEMAGVSTNGRKESDEK